MEEREDNKKVSKGLCFETFLLQCQLRLSLISACNSWIDLTSLSG